MKVTCPHCSQKYQLDKSKFGVDLKCKACHRPMRFDAPKVQAPVAKLTKAKLTKAKLTKAKLTKVKCPSCEQRYSIKESQFGVKIACRKCRHPMRFTAADVLGPSSDEATRNTRQSASQTQATHEGIAEPPVPQESDEAVQIRAPKKTVAATMKAASRRRFRRLLATLAVFIITAAGAAAGVYSYLQMEAQKTAAAKNQATEHVAVAASPEPAARGPLVADPNLAEPTAAEPANTKPPAAEPAATEPPDAANEAETSAPNEVTNEVAMNVDVEPQTPAIDPSQQNVEEYEVAFVNTVVPFFDQHCTRCHGPNRESGGLRVDLLKANLDDDYTLSHLQNIIDEMTVESMPPADEPQPEPQEVVAVVKVLAAIENAAKEEHGTGGGRPIRRLTRTEFINTVWDLLGVRIEADVLPDDLQVGTFESNAETLFLTDMHIRLYLERSRDAVKQFIESRHLERNPQAYNFFVKLLKGGDRNSDSNAEPIIRKFATLMKRGRSTDPTYVDRLTGVFRQGRRQGMSFWEAIEEPLAISMCSMDSMLHFEDRDPEKETRTVSGAELANRLSYTLWRSAPDEELLSLGESGALLDVKIKEQQVKRMMQDEKIERFLTDFTDQWFELPRQDEIAVDQRVFRNFDLNVKPAMKQETIEFMVHVVRANLPIANLIDSDFMMLNEAMARHYGIGDVQGDQFRVVERKGDAADEVRGGILTHAGILMQGGTGDRTSIVERGAFIARKIIDRPPGTPPPNVGELPTTEAETANMTGAQLVMLHASSPQCANCHAKIDPLGMGLEGFDAVGLHRTEEIRLNPVLDSLRKRQRRNPKNHVISVPIDQNGRLHSGEKFEGIAEMKKVLMSKKDDLAKGFIKALLAYTNGRETGLADNAIVESIVKQTVASDYPARTIIEKVMASKVMTSY